MSECGLGTGRDLLCAFANEPASATPLTTSGTPISSWQTLGATQSLNETEAPRRTEANFQGESTTDARITGNDTSITISALDAVDETDKHNQDALRDIFRDAVNAIPPQTPKVWVRITDLSNNQYRYYFCEVEFTERSSEVEGNRTASYTFYKRPTCVDGNREYQAEYYTP